MSHVIEFILFTDALGLDITGPLEVFNTASLIVEREKKEGPAYAAIFTAPVKGSVTLSSGLEIRANASMDKDVAADTLLIPGGPGVNKAIGDKMFMRRIQEKTRRAKRIISVCNGAFILAAAGVLDHKKATTHWLVSDELAKQYPSVDVRKDEIFTYQDNVYTSAGVTAGIDLALMVVEKDFGASIALAAARLLVLYFRRPGSQSQFSAPLKAQEAAGKRFSKLHNWLIKNLRKPILVEQMAEYSAMSQRHFARIFKAATGMTPAKYLETLRLDRARELLAAGHDSLDWIAEATGFDRTERLRRAFLRKFGITPSQYRLHFRKCAYPYSPS